MTISDPRAEAVGYGILSNFTEPNTDKIDNTKATEYFDAVREHFPIGFEEQLWNGGVDGIVNSYLGMCFMTDIDPKECAEIIVSKVGADNG